MSEMPSTPLATRIRRRTSPVLRHLYHTPSAIISGGMVVFTVWVGLVAHWIAPHDPYHTYTDAVLTPPSARFWFGTDDLGRDILSRVIFGARESLIAALTCLAIAAVCGTILGLISGYFRGFADSIIMRAVDIMLAFPDMLLAIVVVAILGPGLQNATIAISIAFIPLYARIVRAETLRVAETEYVRAATVIGASHWRIMVTHILPNVWVPIITVSTINVGTALLLTSGLSYVGIGAQPPAAEWGAMLSNARQYLPDGWWTAVFPGLAITVTVLAFNLFGDALQDAINPRRRDSQ